MLPKLSHFLRKTQFLSTDYWSKITQTSETIDGKNTLQIDEHIAITFTIYYWSLCFFVLLCVKTQEDQ